MIDTDAFFIGIFPSFPAKSQIIEGWNSMEHNIDEWTHGKERAIRYHACERPELAGFGKTESPGLIEMGTVFETICIRRIWTRHSRCQDYFPLGGSSVMFGLGKWRSWFTLHQTTKEKDWLGIEFLDPKKASLRHQKGIHKNGYTIETTNPEESAPGEFPRIWAIQIRVLFQFGSTKNGVFSRYWMVLVHLLRSNMFLDHLLLQRNHCPGSNFKISHQRW